MPTEFRFSHDVQELMNKKLYDTVAFYTVIGRDGDNVILLQPFKQAYQLLDYLKVLLAHSQRGEKLAEIKKRAEDISCLEIYRWQSEGIDYVACRHEIMIKKLNQ